MGKNEYSFNMLLNDIQRMPEEAEDGTEVFENTLRDYQSKLIVMQFLLKLANDYDGGVYYDNTKLRNAIKSKVRIDEQLSGFLFFVSQNPQFDYSWNYMRKRLSSYMSYLADAVSFLRNVLADINMLAGKSWMGKDIHVLFNDVVDVALLKEEPYVSTTLRWENFYRMASVKKDYHISILIKDNIVVASNRRDAKDAEKLIDAALEMFKQNQSQRNEKENEVDRKDS